MADTVTPEEALELLEEEGFVYLDVRSMNEFEGGHPEGAFNVPLKHMMPGGMQDNDDFIDVMEKNFPKSAKLVVGCKAGGRSRAAVALLEEAGYENVRDMSAGWGGRRNPYGGEVEAGWQASGLPVALESEPGRDYTALAGRAGADIPY